MKNILMLIFSFLVVNAFSQEKKLWAKSIINQKAPKLTVEKWLSLQPDTKGKFVLIDFWATWCGPCKRAIPELNQFKTEFANDLIVIGISDEPIETVNKLSNPKIEYYSAIDTERTMYNLLEIRGIPHCILIDPNGIVRWEGYPTLNGFELTSGVIEDIIDQYGNKSNSLNTLAPDYSSYSLKELKNTRTALELELNYTLADSYLRKIERGDVTHMELTKMDGGTVNPYWENVPELNVYYKKWKTDAATADSFIKNHAPEKEELAQQLRKKAINQEEFYKKHGEIMVRLRRDYPNEFPKISQDHVNSLKTMWKQTGRFILEDYKKQEKIFPTYWISQEEIDNFQKTKQYKTINQNISLINKEIIKRK